MLKEKRRSGSSLVLPILGEMIPGGLSYGRNYLLEFDPDSPWYETSLSIAARAVGEGTRVEYHSFMHPPTEIRDNLSMLGFKTAEYIEKKTFRIWDSYTPLTGLSFPREAAVGHTWEVNKPSFLSDLTSDISKIAKEGVAEGETRWLHIDDNTSVINGYLNEQEIIRVWQTRIIPYVRIRDLASIHSIVVGVASEAFYRKFEAFCDGIFDLRTVERSGVVEHYVRVRMMQGRTVDSRWRQLQTFENREIAIGGSQDFGIHGPTEQPRSRETLPVFAASPMMEYLVRAFAEDYVNKKLSYERSGWRGLMEIVSTLKIPRSQVYGDERYGHTFGRPLETLVRTGMVEYRVFEGKGRGGNVLRVRASYEREPVKRMISQMA